jgi:transcriptional regulator with XRE-family HTH domain
MIMGNEAFGTRPPTPLRQGVDDEREDFLLRQTLIEARQNAGLSQSAVARLMGTQAPAICRIESDSMHSPSIRTLRNYARAIGCELEITLKPSTIAQRHELTSPPCLVLLPDFACITE